MAAGAAPIGRSEGEDARFALGLGLTNECNLACAFCYRDPTRVDRLSLDAELRRRYVRLLEELEASP